MENEIDLDELILNRISYALLMINENENPEVCEAYSCVVANLTESLKTLVEIGERYGEGIDDVDQGTGDSEITD